MNCWFMRGIAFAILLVTFVAHIMAVGLLWIAAILAHPLNGAVLLTLLILFLWWR